MTPRCSYGNGGWSAVPPGVNNVTFCMSTSVCAAHRLLYVTRSLMGTVGADAPRFERLDAITLPPVQQSRKPKSNRGSKSGPIDGTKSGADDVFRTGVGATADDATMGHGGSGAAGLETETCCFDMSLERNAVYSLSTRDTARKVRHHAARTVGMNAWPCTSISGSRS